MPGTMPATNVSFYSDRQRIAALLHVPESTGRAPRPAIVMAQGMVGRKELFGFPRIALWGTSFGGATVPYAAAVDGRVCAAVDCAGHHALRDL